MRPREVIVQIREPPIVRAQELVQFPVLVVPLDGQTLRRDISSRHFRIPRGEQAMEGLEILRVVPDACVERVPRSVEVGRS